MRTATTALAWIAATGAAPAQTPVQSWNGLVQNDLFGRAVASVGDLDGDGRADVAVGAPDYTLLTGLVFVYSGRTGRALGLRIVTSPDSSVPGGTVPNSSAGGSNTTGAGLPSSVGTRAQPRSRWSVKQKPGA